MRVNPDLVSLLSMSLRFEFPNPVNEVSARLVAGGVVLLGVACLVLQAEWLLPVLAAGFLLRVAWGPRFDPLGWVVTRWLTPHLGFAERLTPGPPKRFAQAIGATFTVTATLLAFGFGLTGAAYALIAVLVVFATLESVFGFCMGCTVFGVAMRAGVIPDTVCEECNDISLRLARLSAASAD